MLPAFVAGYAAGMEGAERAVPGLAIRLVEAWEGEGEEGRTGIESADAFLAALRMIYRSQPRFDLD